MPGGGNEGPLDLGPAGPQESRRLVQLVDETHGHEHHPRPEVQGLREEEIQVGEFDDGLALRMFVAVPAMLELDLGIEHDAVAEFVARVKHQSKGIGLLFGTHRGTVLQGRRLALVEEFTVATQAEARRRRIDLGRAGAQTEASLLRGFRGRGSSLLRFQFPGHGLQSALQVRHAFFGIWLLLRDGGGRQQGAEQGCEQGLHRDSG